MRLTGPSGTAVLEIALRHRPVDDMTPDGAALRSSVAAVATDIVRDDRAAFALVPAAL